MGISIVMEIDPSGIQDSEWQAVYEESLELINAYDFMDKYLEKGFYGSDECVYVDRSRERNLPFLDGQIGWSTFGDLKTMGYAERFTLIRDIGFYKKNTCSSLENDVYLSRVADSELFETVKNKIPENMTGIFHSKTQGDDYHNYILAVALLIENRFPKSVIIYGDVSRGQMKVAKDWANSVLKRPIQLPDIADDERLYNRINKHFEDELTVLSVFSALTMSNKNHKYGQFLRSKFSVDALNIYFRNYFKSFKINTLGLISVTFDYLNMGFSLTNLCEICVNHQEGPKFDPREYVQFILRQQLHLKEPAEITELKPYLQISALNADSESPDTVDSLLGKAMFKVKGLNPKERVYIPLNTLKETFNSLFDDIDVDAILNELSLKSDAEEYPTELLSKAKELAEYYNENTFYIDNFDTLVQWEPGHTIAKPIKAFLLRMRKSMDQFKELFADSIEEQLRDLIKNQGCGCDIPLIFFFKDKFYIKKTSWEYFIEHANDPHVNKVMIALILLDTVSGMNDSEINPARLCSSLINNTELFEYFFFGNP